MIAPQMEVSGLIIILNKIDVVDDQELIDIVKREIL
jgi:translation elongation factor EF-Tu-like GTPase